jgi:tetraacyldisaccharide 4'-kinase
VHQRDYITLISGERRGAGASIARFGLRVASWFFGAAAVMRLALYRIGLLRTHSVDVPVICVGNLTTGGTGKTPAVAWVVKTLQELGRKPCIVSRGYKADENGNDEQRVLEELCPGVPHIQDPDRVAAARRASADGADVIVLDDGFSHVRLKRDLDILLFDSLNPFGYGRMLPRGLLREPIRSVRRAGFAIFSRADVATPQRLQDLEDTVRCKGLFGGIAHAAHRPVKLVRISEDKAEPLEALKDAVVAPFCGIGNPLGFRRSLEALGARVGSVGVLQLDDHQAFDESLFTKQIDPFLRVSREGGATLAVCTQKDAVKLRLFADKIEADLAIMELRVEFTVTKGENELREAIAAALAK